ncbi:MAG: hypothetical protein R3C19_18915 [Planctomycetaceae bacterium]
MTTRGPIRLLTATLALTALAVAHGPLIVRYFSNRLPVDDPIGNLPGGGLALPAIGVFVLLLATRLDVARLFEYEPAQRVLRTIAVLLFLDVALLVAAYAVANPWLAVPAAWLLSVAVCLMLPERGHRRSVAYVCPVLLFAIGPPPFVRDQFVSALWALTGGLASRLLDAAGYLHLWQRPTLEIPGRTISLEPFDRGGAAGLWVLLFVGLAAIIWSRRRFLHTLILLPVAFSLSVIICCVHTCAAVIARQAYDVEIIDSAASQLIAIASVLVFLGLLYCADSAVTFLTAPIPRQSDETFWVKLRVAIRNPDVARLRNPLNAMWNRAFDDRSWPASQGTGKSGRSSVSSQRTPVRSELLRPSYQFSWLKVFLKSWSRSRPKHRLLIGLPAIAVAVAVTGIVVRVRDTTPSAVTEQYRTALADLTEDNDAADETGLYLRKLLQLRPFDAEVRHDLAMHLLRQHRVDEAMVHVQRLTPVDGAGHAPTRLWLVDQSRKPETVVSLSDEEIEQQLLLAIRDSPMNADTRHQLANHYRNKGQPRLAEQQLLAAIELDARLQLPLAIVQRELNRDETQIAERLAAAAQVFEEALRRDESDEESRRQLVAVRVLQNRTDDAERMLRDRITSSGSSRAAETLAELHRERAAALLAQSNFNRDAAAELITQAIRLNPADVASYQMLLKLKLLDAEFDAADFRGALNHWHRVSETDSASDTDRVVLAELLICIDDHTAAVAALKPLSRIRPQFRPALARQLLLAGDVPDGGRLVQELLAEQQQRLNDDPQDIDAAASLAELLISAGRPGQARDTLHQRLPAIENTDVRGADRQRIETVFTHACLAVFDEQVSPVTSGREMSRESARDTIELLADILRIDPRNREVIRRAAQISFTESALAEPAGQLLNLVLAEGSTTIDVYAMVGSYALLAGDFDQARTYFERAHQLDTDNPIVLNGLALTLIRQSADNHVPALELSNLALQFLPEHPDLLSTRAEVHMAMQNWDAARLDLELSATRKPGSRVTHELLLTVYNALQEPGLAGEQRQILSQIGDE